MPTTVTTEVTLRGDTPPAHAFSFAAVEVRQGQPIRDDELMGGVRLGPDHEITIIGTANQLRQFARAIEDGAMEIERQDAEARRQADGVTADEHYPAQLEEATV